jgi:hypothetical protein
VESASGTARKLAGLRRTRGDVSLSGRALEQREAAWRARPAIAVAGLDLELPIEHDHDTALRRRVQHRGLDVVWLRDDDECLHGKGCETKNRRDVLGVRPLVLLDVDSAEP